MDFYLFVECVEELLEKVWGVTTGCKIRKLIAHSVAEIDENGDHKILGSVSKW